MAKKDVGFHTHREALEFRNNEHLQQLAALFSSKGNPTKKAALVGLIENEMAGEKLRNVYERLDEMQRNAIKESVWDKDGWFRADRFGAKYNAMPVFSSNVESRRFGGFYDGTPTLLCLFLFNPDRYNNPWRGWILPRDLQQRLQEFVPRPSAVLLKTVGELPEFLKQEESE